MFLSVSLGFSGFLWVPRVWAFLGSRSDTLYLQTTYTFRRSSYGMLTSQLWLYTISRRQTIVFVSSTFTPSHSSLTPSWIESRLSLLSDSRAYAYFFGNNYGQWLLLFRTPAHFSQGPDLTCFVVNTLLPPPLQPLLTLCPIHYISF